MSDTPEKKSTTIDINQQAGSVKGGEVTGVKVGQHEGNLYVTNYYGSPDTRDRDPGTPGTGDEIRRLVADDKLEEALDLLEARLKDRDDDLYNDATSHKATLKRAKKQHRRNLISADNEDQERARVRFAILEELLPGVEGLS